ncbi:OsmC family protein [Pseudothauera rhizosphaerae]|uniref:OsmC family protein n=1 Tax=Pseudothauera rhizosphaerae TaxID=2565932 RepID=A0A4S4ALZ1_9RHOO|nr:OsmC family protein [Pseudothauera rhizosphaerae]THF60475.1 OsmC family protein [Pseudothauera rhizosphaerae]
MNADELRQLQAPLKDKYKTEPQAALITLRAAGELDAADVVCRVDTGRALVEAGLHPATGGTGAFACSGNMLLDALVACAGVTLKAVATAIGFELAGGRVSAEGDLDFRGTLGVGKEAPVGFREIRLRFELQTAETQERIDQLVKLTERYCVVFQTLSTPPRLSLQVNAGG